MNETQSDAEVGESGNSRQAALVALNKLFYEGYMVSRAIHVAAELGIADILKSGAMNTEHVAGAVGANPDSLYRLLRALSTIGVFTEVQQREGESEPKRNSAQSWPPRRLLNGSERKAPKLSAVLRNRWRCTRS